MDFLESDFQEWNWPDGFFSNRILDLQTALQNKISGLIPVFLDTGFWIIAREAAFDKNAPDEYKYLLDMMRSSVFSGKVFFPFTGSLIEEFTKQSEERFSMTMKMVDELSLGVSMIPHHERVVVEVENIFRENFPSDPPRDRPIWTHAAFAFGLIESPDSIFGLPNDIMTLAADELWGQSPSEFFNYHNLKTINVRERNDRIASKLRFQHDVHRNDIDSHNTSLRIETEGACSMIAGIAAREMKRLYSKHVQNDDFLESDQFRFFGQEFARLTAKALMKDENRKKLGTIYASSVLHAGLRSNRGQKLKANDLFDFDHAVAGIPYCKAFCTTESSLRTFVTSGHIRLDKLYDCEILSSAEDVRSWLNGLQ